MKPPRGEPRGAGAVRSGMHSRCIVPASARRGVVALLALLATACASLAPEPPASNSLAGRWELDAAASADFDAALARMQSEHQKQRQRARRHREEYGPDGSEIAPDSREVAGFPPVPDEAPDRVRSRLEESLRPPARLLIELDAGMLGIQADDEPARRFDPGQRVGRIDVDGAARQDSGWSGAAFVVRQKYVSGAKREQRYAIDGDALVVMLDYRDPFSDSLVLRSVYRRR